ncbi:MAG: alpha/beta fold hydrolase [Pseudomonadales bacterium]|jgi:alpha-beta hydrolase superfamily lysophospholipase
MHDPRLLVRFALLVLALLLPGQGLLARELVRHAVVVDGHPFAVWSKSPDSPRAVMLLVHGRTWSTRPDFDLQAPGEDLSLMDGLADMGIAAYGVDLRGYGETPRDASGWLTPDRAAEDVAAVLAWVARRHPAVGAPYLFGWSYGSMVSQLVSQRHPDALAGVVLFGYPVRPGIDQNPPSDEPARVPTTAEAAASDFLVPGSISEAAKAAFVTSALASDPVRTDWHELEQWLALDGAQVTVPVLLLQAEHDPYALPEEQEKFFANVAARDKIWAVLPGGDHAAFMETPRPYFLSLIGSFVFRGAAR